MIHIYNQKLQSSINSRSRKINCGHEVMQTNDKYIRALINETIATIDTDPSTTWDDFYLTLSNDAKRGYSALINEVCSYDETENYEKFIDVDDVFEAIVTNHKTTVIDLVNFLIDKVLSDIEWEAEVEQQARYDARYARGEHEYDMERDSRGYYR